MIDIVSCVLMILSGPSNYHKGIDYLKAIYDAPSLIKLLETISFAERTGSAISFDSDIIYRGMEELRCILDLSVDSNSNASDQQKLTIKAGNDWFVKQCQQAILSKCRMR
ncbi:MAG: hypothetical protein K6F06_07290 [Bacteroidales bacterium]|nr:hypothetical protein [Bacteroidales bacterium]